jgi:AAA domain/IclR helix-turn-helix domain
MVNAHYPNAGATVIEELEAREAAVDVFLQLYETPSKVPIDIGPLERFGPFLAPIETLSSARIEADYGTEQEAVRQAVEDHWEKWQQDDHPAIRRFIGTLKRRWLRTYTAPELQGKRFPEKREIVPGLITEGLMIIGGKSGLGKSFWALQLGLAVAQGGKAFGCIDVEQGDVLYLSLEDDEPGMQVRLAMCLEEGESCPSRLTIAHEAPLLSEGLYDRLDAWLRTHPEARLIMVDVLQKVRPPRPHKGSWYEFDYAIGEALKPLAQRYHVAIIIFHHCNKMPKPDDPLDAISDSAGLIAPADIKAVFTRTRGEADAKLFLTGRSVREQWAAFKFDEGQWTYLGDAQEVERSEPRQAILELLRQAEGAMMPNAIAQRLGKSSSAVRYLLHKMAQSGEVKCVQVGWYTAAPITSSPPPNTPNTPNATNTPNTPNATEKLAPSVSDTPPALGVLRETPNAVSDEFSRDNPPIVRGVRGVSNVSANGNGGPHPSPQHRLKRPAKRLSWLYPGPRREHRNGSG